LRLSILSDVKRVDPNRLSDILKVDGAEIAGGEVKPSLDLTIGVLGEADRSWLGVPFQSRGDIDALAHQVAVGLLDDVAEMNADPELEAAMRRQTSIAVGHAILYLNRAAHGVDCAAKLDNDSVTSSFDDAAMMDRMARSIRSLRRPTGARACEPRPR
jgi:hypothetical protein